MISILDLCNVLGISDTKTKEQALAEFCVGYDFKPSDLSYIHYKVNSDSDRYFYSQGIKFDLFITDDKSKYTTSYDMKLTIGDSIKLEYGAITIRHPLCDKFSLIKQHCNMLYRQRIRESKPRPEITIFDSTGMSGVFQLEEKEMFRCVVTSDSLNARESDSMSMRYSEMTRDQLKDRLCYKSDVDIKYYNFINKAVMNAYLSCNDITPDFMLTLDGVTQRVPSATMHINIRNDEIAGNNRIYINEYLNLLCTKEAMWPLIARIISAEIDRKYNVSTSADRLEAENAKLTQQLEAERAKVASLETRLNAIIEFVNKPNA